MPIEIGKLPPDVRRWEDGLPILVVRPQAPQVLAMVAKVAVKHNNIEALRKEVHGQPMAFIGYLVERDGKLTQAPRGSTRPRRRRIAGIVGPNRAGNVHGPLVLDRGDPVDGLEHGEVEHGRDAACDDPDARQDARVPESEGHKGFEGLVDVGDVRDRDEYVRHEPDLHQVEQSVTS